MTQSGRCWGLGAAGGCTGSRGGGAVRQQRGGSAAARLTVVVDRRAHHAQAGAQQREQRLAPRRHRRAGALRRGARGAAWVACTAPRPSGPQLGASRGARAACSSRWQRGSGRGPRPTCAGGGGGGGGGGGPHLPGPLLGALAGSESTSTSNAALRGRGGGRLSYSAMHTIRMARGGAGRRGPSGPCAYAGRQSRPLGRDLRAKPREAP